MISQIVSQIRHISWYSLLIIE